MSTTTPDLAKLHAEINQHPYVKLLRSKDPMMWYSSRVGEMIRVIGVNLDGYWAREGNKYNSINVIRFSDCEWVPHPLSHITPSAPDAPQGNNPAWTLASKVREALRRKACPGYYTDVAVEAVVHNYIYAAAPAQEPAVNMSCKSTQATDAVKADAWGNTQLTNALMQAEAERDQLRAQVERLQSQPAAWECFLDPSYFDMWAVKQIGNTRFDAAYHVTSEVEARRLCAMLNSIETRKQSFQVEPAVNQQLTTAAPAVPQGAEMPLSMNQFGRLVELTREHLSDNTFVFKATSTTGDTCHFGVESVAKAWAKGGSVEAIKVREFKLHTPAAPAQEPAVNLSCKSTQARLAAQWGYVPAPSQPVTLTDEVFAALELDPEAFRTEGGAVNAGKLKAAILHPYNYLHPDHWLQARFSKPGGRPLVTDQAALSDEDIDKIADDYEDECGRIRVDQVFAFARAIIAALREKGALR